MKVTRQKLSVESSPAATTPDNSNSHLRGTLLMVFATLCLSSSSLLAKYVYREGVGPVTMLDLRFVVAAAVLWLFYLSAKNWRQYIWLKSRRQFWGCVAVGGANALSQSLYFVALQELDPGLAQMIFSFNPAIIALIMLFFGERLTRLKIARLGLGLGGLYFLTLAGGNAGQSVPAFSVLLIMFCSVVYAVHMVLYQKLLPGTSSRTNTLYILTTMAVIYSVIELFQRGVSGVAGVDATAWIFILVMALVSTSVARLLMFGGLALIGGTQAALIGIGEPVIVLFSSVWLLGERLTLNQWLGAGLIICSIALAAIRIDGRRNRQARLGQP